MSRRTNVINGALYLILTMASMFVAVYVCNLRYSEQLVTVVLWFILGAVVAGIINTFVHELAHLFAGKINGFAFSEITVWFFKWTKVRNKIRFSFTMMKDEAGYTEMIPKSRENLEKRYKSMTLAGPIASFFCILIGVVPFFVVQMPLWAYCMLSVFLPVSVYFFFGSILPQSSYGVRNDGAVAYGIAKMDDVSRVTVNLLAIQSEMYNGKTPSEIEQSLYFDLPQLPEDNPVFFMLLNARYNYYLDKEDYDNAKKTTERLLSLEEYMIKPYLNVVKTDALYNACTFDYNEEVADDLMYELEKYLNNVNSTTNVRVKLAYLLYVRREKDFAEMFFNKATKEASRSQIKGYGNFEKKLLEKMKVDF